MNLLNYNIFSLIIFSIGCIGCFTRRQHLVSFLICLELMLLAVNTNFLAASSFHKHMEGQIFVFFSLTIAASEAALGLALLILLFRKHGKITPEIIESLRG